ncbi:Glucan endo-1,3-beta-glucosidase [Linum perenne]
MAISSSPSILLLLFISLHLLLPPPATAAIGVNYGTTANNLPPPSQVASFLRSKTTIDRIKLFDANPDILRAFSGTGISVTVTIPNADVPSVAKLPAAQSWIAANVSPFHPSTKFRYILVGNEVLFWKDRNVIAHTLPALRTVHHALQLANLTDIKVTTPHAFSFLADSRPASAGRFRRFDGAILGPILDFHLRTRTPFMVNPYPFFSFAADTIDYALFRKNRGIYDKVTGILYTNLFDELMDAAYSAMKKLDERFADVEIVIGETGWPSAGDPNQMGVGLENAVSYNRNVVKRVSSGKGTPLMPNRTFETYLFALFNENLKHSVSEQNYGLFRPDFTAVYDVGVLRSPAVRNFSTQSPANGRAPAKSPPSGNKKWCVAKSDASDEQLQKNLDYVCSSGVNCRPIQQGGPCFNPNTVRSHASYAMNAYYQTYGRHDSSCDFGHTGFLTSDNPSYETCSFVTD